jgi:dihydrofolate reductase
MSVSLIAALASNGVIGRGNQLPWHLPEDLKYFKRVTQGHPVVMGRKTYESIGRLLPNRENRIVTRNADYRVEGARVFGSVEEACLPNGYDGEIFVIGGSEIYAQALKHAHRLYLTRIEKAYEGDARFPEFDAREFREVSREAHEGFSFVVLERR